MRPFGLHITVGGLNFKVKDGFVCTYVYANRHKSQQQCKNLIPYRTTIVIRFFFGLSRQLAGKKFLFGQKRTPQITYQTVSQYDAEVGTKHDADSGIVSKTRFMTTFQISK